MWATEDSNDGARTSRSMRAPAPRHFAASPSIWEINEKLMPKDLAVEGIFGQGMCIWSQRGTGCPCSRREDLRLAGPCKEDATAGLGWCWGADWSSSGTEAGKPGAVANPVPGHGGRGDTGKIPGTVLISPGR